MDYLAAFLTGGVICLIGQLLIDLTGITPARILTGYVVAGVLLQAIGIYQFISDIGVAGASVPLCGFGSMLAKGVAKEVAKDGAMGILKGGIIATATGITAAVFFGLIAALLFKPGDKH